MTQPKVWHVLLLRGSKNMQNISLSQTYIQTQISEIEGHNISHMNTYL
jgi:hypothetical protein